MNRNAIIFSLLLLVSSCQETQIDIAINESTPRLVLGGLFAPNEQMVIKLTRSVPIRESTVFTGFDVENARVELYEEDEYTDLLNFRPGFDRGIQVRDLGAYYTTPGFFPDPEKTYTLVIEAPGFESIRATSAIPKAVEIQTFEVDEVSFNIKGLSVVAANLSFLDDASENNY